MSENHAHTAERDILGELLAVSAVIAVVAAAYLPALDIFLHGDDFEWLRAARDALCRPASLGERVGGFFRPLVTLSFLADYLAFGVWAPGYAATTLGIHLLNVAGLFLLGLGLFGSRCAAATFALLFGVSSRVSEVTLWSSGRADSLLLLFTIGLLLVLQRGASDRVGRVAAVVVTLAAAASKDTWVVVPVLSGALLVVVAGDTVRAALRRTWDLLLLAFAYLLWAAVLPALQGVAGPLDYGGLGPFESLLKWCAQLLHLAGVGRGGELEWWKLLLLPLLAAGWWWLRRGGWRTAEFFLVWTMVTSAVTATVPHAPSRYAYLPLVGFWGLVVAVASGTLRRIELSKPALVPAFRAGAAIMVAAVVLLQLWWLRLEMDDYRRLAEPHRQLADWFCATVSELPNDQPFVFVDTGRREVVAEVAAGRAGWPKSYFVRGAGLWQLVEITALASACGELPGGSLCDAPMEQWPDAVGVLVFHDGGFAYRRWTAGEDLPDPGTAGVRLLRLERCGGAGLKN